MRFWVLTFLILGPIGLSASFAGVTASPKPAQVARPQGAPSAPVVPNEVVFKPPPPRNRAFYGDGIPHGPNQPTQNPANNTSEEDVNPPLKPLGSPFGNQTVKQGAF